MGDMALLDGDIGDGPEDSADGAPEDDSWLSSARDAYEQSSEWFDASIRPSVEKALAHFQNRHAPGSKYYSDAYKFRAKGFRPKTRASIRRNEAAAATAFFSTADMVSISAQTPGNRNQIMSAQILTELINYRLDDSIPWFLTLVGAYQTALNVGVVVSHQSWEFTEESSEMPELDEMGGVMTDDAGSPVMREVKKIVTDKPTITLVAIENIRISPAADWTDPMGTTPYIIELIPMFIGDIKEMMEGGSWVKYEDGEIKQAVDEQYDSIRAARDGKKRQDGLDVVHATSDFDTAWVHRNIIRRDGEDYLFYTLGTALRLSDPVPLTREYRHLRPGERPYVMGFAVMEAHKVYPAGLNELVAPLQEDANEIRNQRHDNVALAMNRRYFAKRTATVDYRSLTRNVPGSVTLVDDINGDVRSEAPPDVTASAYAEQDRINLDFDELAGSFSPGSVQSNRALNETVGGMNLLSADANVMTEYQLRVFSETWVEPVIKQLVRMEQAYETDQVVLAIAGQRAQAFEKFGVSEITDALIQGMVNVEVAVGFGATNPQQRVERLAMGIKTVAAFAPQAMQALDIKEVAAEVFGALGYKGSDRFFPEMGKPQQNPQIAALTQQIQQLQQVIATKEIEQKGKVQLKGMEIQAEAAENEKDRMLEQWTTALEASIEKAKLTGDQRMAFDSLKTDLARDVMKLRAQERISSMTSERQVLRPPSEPPGRAPDGQAFQR